jgi:hypothetical protein
MRPSAVNRRTAGADTSANACNRAETIAADFYREAQPPPIPEIGQALFKLGDTAPEQAGIVNGIR